MALTPIATQSGLLTNGAATNITVATGVTSSHFGVLVCTTGQNTTTSATTFTASGWTSQAANPSVAGNMNFTVFTKLGGSTAGGTITVTPSGFAATGSYALAWYDTGGFDVAAVSTPSGRNGTSAATTTITGLTTIAPNMPVIVVAGERTTATGTVISSWAPSAPTQDIFYEDTSGTAVSGFIGHFTQATAGATGSYTATYNSASGNGVGVMLAISTGVFAGSVSLGGTGTFTETASASISGSDALSASGTLGVTPKALFSDTVLLGGDASGGLDITPGSVVQIDRVTFGGSGGVLLVASGSPAGQASFNASGEGTLTASGGPPARRYNFQTPVMQRYMPFLPALPVLMNYSPALLFIQGQWVQTEYPSAEQIAAATYYFPGGYELSLDHDTARALVVAGFTVDGWDEVLPADSQLGTAFVGTALVGGSTLG